MNRKKENMNENKNEKNEGMKTTKKLRKKWIRIMNEKKLMKITKKLKTKENNEPSK